jgi:hypothetical protein
MTRSAEGRNTAIRAIDAPSAPEGPLIVTAPRKAENVNKVINMTVKCGDDPDRVAKRLG